MIVSTCSVILLMLTSFLSKITEQVETIIQPVLNDLNFELVEVEFTKEGKDHFLRVSIDKVGK
jgi:ribosome maturation factor RimP